MVNFGLFLGISSTLLVDAFVASPRILKFAGRTQMPMTMSTGIFHAAKVCREEMCRARLTKLCETSQIFRRVLRPTLLQAQDLRQRHTRLLSQKSIDSVRMQGSKYDYSPLMSEMDDPEGGWKRLAEWAWLQGIRWGQWKVAETLPGIRGAVATSPVQEGEVQLPNPHKIAQNRNLLRPLRAQQPPPQTRALVRILHRS